MADDATTREIPFQVDMAGIVEILGRSLYSRRDTALRELLQNAHDAIIRRRIKDLGYLGEIRLRLDPEQGTLSVEDDGVGITRAEAERYLGTLGVGLSGLIKRDVRALDPEERDATGIIGQFGVGLFSAFLLAERVVVESRFSLEQEPVRWEAGAGTTIRVGPGSRELQGTLVTLHLAEDAREWSKDPERLKEGVARYAEFLPVPIYLEDSRRRLNVMTPSWFEPTPDPEMVSMELEQRFDDTPLDVIVIRREKPVRVQGALFITRRRTPGFSGRPHLTATVRRMVISPRIDGLFPEWGSFYRGVLELPDLQPTTSREDLIKDDQFQAVREELEEALLGRLHQLAREDPIKLRSILTWHRYSFAGAALDDEDLRDVLREAYPFQTTQGTLTFKEIVHRSKVESFLEPNVDAVIWFNGDRAQERWTQTVFAELEQPCVQAYRTFETTLLTLLADDAAEDDQRVVVQLANPVNERFVSQVLQVRDLHDVNREWQDFFAPLGVKVRQDSFRGGLPVLAFPCRAAELKREFEELKRGGTIPAAFSRMLDRHFDDQEDDQDQVILNTRHELVSKALSGSTKSPLASVLRLLVHNALITAGVVAQADGQETVQHDLSWIAETISSGRKA